MEQTVLRAPGHLLLERICPGCLLADPWDKDKVNDRELCDKRDMQREKQRFFA